MSFSKKRKPMARGGRAKRRFDDGGSTSSAPSLSDQDALTDPGKLKIEDEDGNPIDVSGSTSSSPKLTPDIPLAPKDSSFGSAFRTARNNGDKTFTWNGKSFTTDLAGDKSSTPSRRPPATGSSSTPTKTSAGSSASPNGPSNLADIAKKGAALRASFSGPNKTDKPQPLSPRASSGLDNSQSALKTAFGSAKSNPTPKTTQTITYHKPPIMDSPAATAARDARDAGNAKGGKTKANCEGGKMARGGKPRLPVMPKAGPPSMKPRKPKGLGGLNKSKIPPGLAAALAGAGAGPPPGGPPPGGPPPGLPPPDPSLGGDPSSGMPPGMKRGGKAKVKPKGFAKGGKASSSKSGKPGMGMMGMGAKGFPSFAKGGSIDGCALRGHTRARRSK
jgi:hypothetical protein